MTDEKKVTASEDTFDDDDFEDFGGFEAAEPVAAQEAQPIMQGIQASVSPWAVLTGAVVDPHFLEAGPGSSGLNIAGPQVKLTPGMDGAESGEHSAVEASGTPSLEPTGTEAMEASETESVEAIGTEAVEATGEDFADFKQYPSNSSVQCNGSDSLQSTRNSTETETLKQEELDQNGHLVKSESIVPDFEPGIDSGLDTATASSELDNTAQNAVIQDLREKLTQSQLTKTELQKDMMKLTEDFKKAESLQSDLKKQLDEEKEKYELLQAKHAAELENLHQAGHDALAIIVEEYKVLCKVSVLQALEAHQVALQDAMSQQANRCTELLQKQEERLKINMEEEKQKMEEHIAEALGKQQELHQHKLEEALSEERQKSEDKIKAALEIERDTSQRMLEEAVQAEREKTRLLLVEERDKLSQSSKEERARNAEAVAAAVKQETARCKEHIMDAVKEERCRGEDALQKTTEKLLQELREKLAEQAQSEASVRRRQLASMDLFLESARKQLAMLMQDKPEL